MPLRLPWQKRSSSPTPKSFPSGITLMHEGKNDAVDIIFIHGLTGDREATWTAKNASEPWIKTLLPPKLPNARILSFGYDAYVTNWRGMVSKNRIANHSMNLINAVATYRDEDDTNTRPIIFVCHSLGGLVCKDALIQSRQRPEKHLQNIFLSTRAIAFLGTPHTGAALAEWAKQLAKSLGLIKQTNSQIVAVLETDSEVLARIQDNFHTMIRSREQHNLPVIWITCFYEELPMIGVGVVVPLHSAIIPGYTPIGIHKNHSDMTKFETDDHPGFVAVVGELRRWVKELGIPTRVSVPSSQGLLRDDEAEEAREGKKAEQVEQERPLSFQLSKITSRENATTQANQQTFYSNVNRRSVGRFVERQDLQEELRSWIRSDSSPGPIVLYGIGGAGKTQLAIQCCREAELSGFLATLWVDASSPMSVEQSYHTIAKEIQIGVSDEDDIETTISLVQSTLRSWSERWLMVFDNYDNPKGFQKRTIKEYIPESQNGHILFTSRHAGLEHLGATQMSVSSMTQSESLDLLLRRLPSDPAEEAEGIRVADTLGHLALALDQAGAYMRARKLPLSEFLSHYEKRKDKIFREVPDDWEYRGQSGPLSVFTTWEMSFDLISGDEKTVEWKTDFLTLAGFFDCKRVSERYFQAYCDAENVEWMDLCRVCGEWDSCEFGDVLAELHKLSLIQLPDQEFGERSFSIHPIVCDWLVYRRGIAIRKRMTLELIHAMSSFLKDLDEQSPPLEVIQETILHLDCCLRHVTAVPRTFRGIGIGSLPKVASRFARFYLKQGRYADAEQLFRQALSENEVAFGPSHPDTLNIVENLAITSRRQGNYDLAELLFKRVLDGRGDGLTSSPGIAIPEVNTFDTQILRSQKVKTLLTIQNLANVYSDQGRYDEAEHLFERLLEGIQGSLGPNDLETLGARQNLANVYRKRGRYEDAERLYRGALKAKEKNLGPEHLDTLGTVENLANVYRNQKRYREAERMFLRSVQSKETKLGSEHPDTLRAVQNLANVYSDQGQYQRAERLYQRALQGNEKMLGLKHPDTLRTVENLANLYSKASSEKLELASSSVTQQLFERALEGNEEKRGPNHPETLSTMDSLAIFHYRGGDYPAAEKLLERAVSGKEKHFGTHHPDTLGTVKSLGNVYYKLGRYADAEREYKRVLDGKERLEHPIIAWTVQNLASIYIRQERDFKAAKLLLSSKTPIPEAQAEKDRGVSLTTETLPTQRDYNLSKESMIALPRGKLSLSVVRGRGLRPSGDPFLVCQFQGVSHISEEPIPSMYHTIRGKGIDVSTPIPTPRKIGSSDPQSHRTRGNWEDPEWEWNVIFDVFGNDTEVDIHIYDRTGGGACLGLIRFQPELTEYAQSSSQWYSLVSQNNKEDPNITGEMLIITKFQRTEPKEYTAADFGSSRLIGQGKLGQLYQILKKDTRCVYAMKVWSKQSISTTYGSSSIQTRIPSLPFIGNIKFLLETPLDLYIIGDYLRGRSLFFHLDKAKGFSKERTKFYASEIVLGLQYLHAHDIVYRDLKPENILLDASGHITLCNFSLLLGHKPLEKDNNDFHHITEYMAPEVVLTERHFTKVADFWSLAIIIWEMTCGWSPFSAENTELVAMNILFGKVRFPKGAFSPEVRDFIKQLLRRNPEQRLGANSGANELKKHRFLANVNWDALAAKAIKPPFNPLVHYEPSNPDSDLDAVFPDGAFPHEGRTPGHSMSTPFTLGMQANFKGFTFVDEGAVNDDI